jgi:hypothetical protein
LAAWSSPSNGLATFQRKRSGLKSSDVNTTRLMAILTEDDKLVCVNNVIKGKLLESEVLLQQEQHH